MTSVERIQGRHRELCRTQAEAMEHEASGTQGLRVDSGKGAMDLTYSVGGLTHSPIVDRTDSFA